MDVSVICTWQAYFSSDFDNLIIYFFRFITCHWLVIFQVYYLPLIGYFSGLLLAIGWLFLQVYYLQLIGYFSGLLLAVSSVLQSVYTTNYIHHISIGQKYFCEGANHHCSWTFSKLYYSFVTMLLKRLSWSWLYGSWIYKYLCNLCLSPLRLVKMNPAHGEMYSIQHYVISLSVTWYRSVVFFLHQ